MKVTGLIIVLFVAIRICFSGFLTAQQCDNWYEPDSLSDSNEDNRNATMARIGPSGGNYFVFWDRFLEVFGSEIVCMNYYTGEAETVILAE